MEKLLEILWDISNNKWINHKFDFQSDVRGLTTWEISIHLHNVIEYLKFLMGYQGFGHNQTYKPFCISNKNKHQA